MGQRISRMPVQIEVRGSHPAGAVHAFKPLLRRRDMATAATIVPAGRRERR
jgi:hypothetical protein